MKVGFLQQAAEYKQRHRRKKKWKKAVTTMASVVVFCTTYALILPAITLGNTAFCGIAEHSHGETCYETPKVALACPLETHRHTQACHDAAGNAVCGYADYVIHSHDSNCCDSAGNLICDLSEVQAHKHTPNCYAVPETEKNEEVPAETPVEAQNTHVHEDACYTLNRGELVCTEEEQEGHGHTAESGCYSAETGELVCQIPESGGHQHSDECYALEKSLTCELPEETAVQVPEEEAIAEPAEEKSQSEEAVLVCQQTELTPHSHVSECYGTDGKLSCGKIQVIVHSHSEGCFEPIDPDAKPKLICGMEEHDHDVACMSDPTADVETKEDWESTVANVSLTGDRGADVLAVAQTQLGYTESSKNYHVAEDGRLLGYTRFGQWYGVPYGDWCAMYASFCLHYAGVKDVPLHSHCGDWIKELSALDRYFLPGDGQPTPGDLIFFDWKGDGRSDHVGLVAEIIPGEEGKSDQIKTIEGNSADRVRYVTYDSGDKRIMGYGRLSEEDPETYFCGMDEHSHGESCYDAYGSQTCELTEHTHSDECMGCKVFYTDDTMRVFATIRGVQDLPKDLALEVWQVTAEQDPTTYGAMQSTLCEQVAAGTQYVSASSFYQMQLLSGGEVYQLPESAEVTVNVEFASPVFQEEDVAESVDMHTFVLTPDAETAQDAERALEGEVQTYAVARAVVTNTATTDQTAAKAAYQAEVPAGVDYENTEQGVTGLSFQTNSLGAFAVALSTETQTGTYWTRVTSTAELASGGTFMIVSAEGNYALRGNDSANYTAVTLQTVKGNTQYYTISSSDDPNLRWTFSGSGSSYTIQNQGTKNYIYLSSRSVISSSSRNFTLTYYEPENCWRITYTSYSVTYALQNSGTGAFGRTNAADSTERNTNHYNTRDMLIFKLSDVTELQVPSDVTAGASDTTPGTPPKKPNYGDFIEPSGSKTGDTAVVGADASAGSVSGKYYSDQATSDIETKFREDVYADNERNDGKVMTDKSVIYRGDDYGAFSEYLGNTFGVTLSALGQEYEISQTDVVRTPIDVVFVLDVSGSMATDGEDGRDASRAEDMTAAVNSAMAEIHADHPANRVGMVIYSGGAWEMLPLNRYKATNNQYLVCEEKSYTHKPTNYSVKAYFVKGSASLENESGKSYANVGNDAIQGFGTYTQAGIALGNKVFSDVGTDTKYTTTIGEDEYERTYTVNRQPVFILLSDGEPTYSTNIFMDVLNGPHYGDGNGGAANSKGIHGYNTILSANYYKRMVGIQYDNPALFFTVGMGINTEEQGDGPQVSGSSTGDNYKRAVLNPTPEVIQKLTSSLNANTTTTQLKNLLNSTFTEQAVQVMPDWPELWTGVPHKYVPALQANPYAGNYSYADGAYFGLLTREELKKIFSEIVADSIKSRPYGFILYRNSSVKITDNVGEGMEIKGVPVLRYGGKNYSDPSVLVDGNVTTYTYSGTFEDPHIPDRKIDLTQIKVTVTTDSSGNQVVEMYVPDTALPTYTPELIGKEFYYESLPVRLIYQVGLTADSEQRVLDLQRTGGQLTFYTNRWDESNVAVSTLLPSSENPYYHDANQDGTIPPYNPYTITKTEAGHVTATQPYVDASTKKTVSYEDETTTQIVDKLGNNGKLVFGTDVVEIPVEKHWEGVDAGKMMPVEIKLYKVQESAAEEGGSAPVITQIDTATLSNENGWTHTFHVMAPGEDWYYVIVETVPEGYYVQYAGNGEAVEISLDNGKPVKGIKVDLTAPENVLVSITNTLGVELPHTGGAGTHLYTAAGLLLIALASILLLYNQEKRGRGNGFYS